MRYPAFLNKDGKIGFIAPSFGCTTSPYKELFQRACTQFHAKGYKTELGPNCFCDCGIGKSNTARRCAEEINDFFINGRSDVIISCGGGETMCEDLSFVDFSNIAKARPTWYMGYSDNTNLTFLLPTICDTAAIYGPCVSSFGSAFPHQDVGDAWELLCGTKLTVHSYDGWEKDQLKSPDNPFVGYHITEPYHQVSYPNSPVHFSGRLLGGCLDVLSILCGTRFDNVAAFNDRYKTDGIIWFLEACDLNPMGIRCALWHLKEAGWFRYTKGFLIGRPRLIDAEIMGADHINSVIDSLSCFNVPILMDLDIGHLPPMMPLICGAFANVYSDATSVTVEHVLR